MPASRTTKKATSAGKANGSAPGVQKIKASIRQTTRLLAKDSLAADVRVETERRLKALQADLDQALKARVEKTNATRYHKVKFFERKKAIRKITQTKKHLQNPSLDAKERKELQKTLFSQRVDLNYILHFPNTQKYISLYPSTTSSDEPSTSSHPPPTAAETDTAREAMRKRIRKAMKSGEMEGEPEEHLAPDERPQGGLERPRAPASALAPDDEAIDEEGEADVEERSLDATTANVKTKKGKHKTVDETPGKKDRKSKKKDKSGSGVASEAKLTVEGDDFFGDD